MRYVICFVSLLLSFLLCATTKETDKKKNIRLRDVRTSKVKSYSRLVYDLNGTNEVWFFSFMRCRMKVNEDYTYYRYRKIPKNGRVYYEGGGTLEICDEKFVYLGKTNSLHAAGGYVLEPTAIFPNHFIW